MKEERKKRGEKGGGRGCPGEGGEEKKGGFEKKK